MLRCNPVAVVVARPVVAAAWDTAAALVACSCGGLRSRPLLVPEKYPVQHEGADKHEDSHANAKAVGPKKVVVDKRGADCGQDHDGQRHQESGSPMHWHHSVARIQSHARRRRYRPNARPTRRLTWL